MQEVEAIRPLALAGASYATTLGRDTVGALGIFYADCICRVALRNYRCGLRQEPDTTVPLGMFRDPPKSPAPSPERGGRWPWIFNSSKQGLQSWSATKRIMEFRLARGS